MGVVWKEKVKNPPIGKHVKPKALPKVKLKIKGR